MDRRLVELGPHCGKRGPYSFYKSFKYTDNGVWRTVATDQFFFVNISVSTPLCIGEMQLLWTVRNNVSDPLSSLRLYFLPEQLPDGRQHYHGENEVIATEKIVIRLSDLVTWLVSPTNESEWPVGLPWPLALQPRTSSSTANSKAATDGALVSTSPVVVVSYPKYCRLMAALRRLESSPLAASLPSLLLGLGGDEAPSKHAMTSAADGGLPTAAALLLLQSAAVAGAAPLPRDSSAFAAAAVSIVYGLPCTLSPNAKLVFCRSTCEHPEVEDHEFRCDYLAPNLKSRSRKRRVAAKQTESSESENDASPVADCAAGSPRTAAASAIAADSFSNETVAQAPKSRAPRKSNGTVRTKGINALPVARKREGATSAEQEEEDSFLKSVYSFMKERGTPIHRLPCLGFKQIDLYELYKGAEKLGGYNQICQKRRWKLLYDQIGGNPTNTSAATCTRKHYERLLLPFEQHLKGQPSGSDRLAILDRQSSSPSSSSSAGPPDAAEAVAPTDAEATVAEADGSRRSGAVICNETSAQQAASAADAIDGPAESCEQPATNRSPTNWRVGSAAAPSAPTGGCGPTSGDQLPVVANRHGSGSSRRRSPSSSDDRRVTMAADERKPKLPPPPALVPQHFGAPGSKLETALLPEAARHHHHHHNIVDAQDTLVQDKLADGAVTDKWSDGRSSHSPSRESSFQPVTAPSRSSAVVTSASHVGAASQYLSLSASGTGSDQRQFYRAPPSVTALRPEQWPHSSGVNAASSAPSTSVVGGALPVSASAAAATSSSSRAAVTATTWRVPTNEAATVTCSDALSAAAHALPASSGRERGVPPGASPAPGAVQQFRPLAVAGSGGGARAPRNDSSGGGSSTSCRAASGAVLPPPAHRHHSQQREAGPGATLPSAGNSRPSAVATARSVAVAHLGGQSLVAALQPRLGAAFEAAACADVTAAAQSKQQPVPAAHARPLAAVAALQQLVYGCVPEELVRLQRLRFPVVVCPYRYDCRTVYSDPGTAVVLVASSALNGPCSAAAAAVGGSSKRKHDSAIAAASAVASGSHQPPPPPLHRGGGTPVHDLTCKRPRLPGGSSSSSCWTPDIRSGWSPNGIVGGVVGDSGSSSSHGGVSAASQQQQQQHQQYHHRSLSAPQPSRKPLHHSLAPTTEAESQLAVAAGLLRPAATATGHQPGRAAGRSTEAGLSSLPPVPRAHAAPSLLAVAPSMLLQQQQPSPWTVTDVSPSVAAAVRPAFAGADSRSGRRATAAVDGSAEERAAAAATFRSASAADRLGRAAAAAAAVTAPFQDPYAVAVAAHGSSQQLRTTYELLAGTGQACGGVPPAAAGRLLQQLPSPLIHRRDPSPSGATTHSRPPSTAAAGRSLAATGAASLPASLVSCREAAEADGVGAGGRNSNGGGSSSSGGKGGEARHSSSTADSRLAGRQYL